jgi:hypothetical protein
MTIWDVVGYVAVATNVAGNLLLTGKSQRAGFAVRIIPNALWLAHGVVQHDGSVILNALVFAIINGVGVWRHRTKAESTA